MEIPEKGPLYPLQTGGKTVETLSQTPVEVAADRSSGETRDTVELTQHGPDYRSALQQSQSLPEIREDRVTQLKRQLAEGTYRVKGDRISVKMIDETLENNSVLKHIDTKV